MKIWTGVITLEIGSHGRNPSEEYSGLGDSLDRRIDRSVGLLLHLERD